MVKNDDDDRLTKTRPSNPTAEITARFFYDRNNKILRSSYFTVPLFFSSYKIPIINANRLIEIITFLFYFFGYMIKT